MPKRSPFALRKMRPERLLAWGFDAETEGYTCTRLVQGGSFCIRVRLMKNGRGQACVQPAAPEDCGITDDICIEFCWNGAGVTEMLRWPRLLPWYARVVKPDVEALLAEIAELCFEPDVFRASQTLELAEFVRKRYGDELEYLWKRFPENAVWRRADSRKWYAAVLTVSRRKLGLNSEERMEILDFRVPPDEMEQLVDHVRFFPGYHMNKRNWCTLILDGSVPMEELIPLLERSYSLAR